MGDNNSHGGLYLAVGALAAVGAGYLVWRYVLADETKDRIRGRVREAAHEARIRAGEYAREKGHEAAEYARHKGAEMADAARVAGAHAADAAGDALKRRAAAALERSEARVDTIR